MNEPRDIRVTFTRDEFAAVQRTVRGEPESLTDQDWESGTYDDLDAGSSALSRAWSRYMRRSKVAS